MLVNSDEALKFLIDTAQKEMINAVRGRKYQEKLLNNKDITLEEKTFLINRRVRFIERICTIEDIFNKLHQFEIK